MGRKVLLVVLAVLAGFVLGLIIRTQYLGLALPSIL